MVTVELLSKDTSLLTILFFPKSRDGTSWGNMTKCRGKGGGEESLFHTMETGIRLSSQNSRLNLLLDYCLSIIPVTSC